MSWFRRGAASVLGRELGQWPYPIGFSRVLRDRDRATANDLEANVCSFTYMSFCTIGSTLRVLIYGLSHRLHLFCDCPQKGAQLTSNGCGHDRLGFAPGGHTSEAGA